MTDRSDNARFVAFYQANYSLILTTCSRRLSDHKAAEDVTAEVFRVAWQRSARGLELELAWLYRVARNLVGNEYRRARRMGRLHQEAAFTLDRTPTSDPDRQLEVRTALAELRPSDRELLFMAYWEDLTPPEMAAILGCSVPALWVRLNRARTALRRRLGDHIVLQEASARG